MRAWGPYVHHYYNCKLRIWLKEQIQNRPIYSKFIDWLILQDITEVDRDYMPGLMCIRDMDADTKAFAAMDMAFSTPSAAGQEVLLSNR